MKKEKRVCKHCGNVFPTKDKYKKKCPECVDTKTRPKKKQKGEKEEEMKLHDCTLLLKTFYVETKEGIEILLPSEDDLLKIIEVRNITNGNY